MFAIKMPENVWRIYKQTVPRISSTELSSVLGLNKYKSRQRLFREKQSIGSAKVFSTAAIQWGVDNEPVARDWFLMRFDPLDTLSWRKPSLLLDYSYPICVSPDAVGENVGLEIKCLFSRLIPPSKQDIYAEHLIQCFCCVHVIRAWWCLFYFNVNEPEKSLLYVVLPLLEAWWEFGQQANMFINALLAHQQDNAQYIRPIKREERGVNQRWMQKIKEERVFGPFTMDSGKLPFIFSYIGKHLPSQGQIPELPDNLFSVLPDENQMVSLKEEPHTSQSELSHSGSDGCSLDHSETCSHTPLSH